ncbi:MAG: hypothetical protein ACWGHH_04305 [Sulfurovaceae bacterium]
MLNKYNLDLEHPANEYIQAQTSIYYGVKEITSFESKALVWLPQKTNSLPYLYLLIDDYRIYNALETFKYINIKAKLQNQEIFILLKNLLLTSGNYSSSSDKGYIKYHMPRFVVKYNLFQKHLESKKFTFKISDSELLRSKIYSFNKYRIDIDTVAQLGIKSIKTDNRIENNILHIEMIDYINSYYSFKRQLEPIINLIINLASFAERRRLTWSSYICEDNGSFEYYNCRKEFNNDKKVYRLISDRVFSNFLLNSLKNISKDEITYFNKILMCLNRSRKYPTDAKIIVLNTALEIVLKKNFGFKNDNSKVELVKKLGIVTFDLPDIKNLIDIRNDITHGDYISSRNQFFYANKWSILLERIVLNELGWKDLSMTDVNYIKGSLVLGLV